MGLPPGPRLSGSVQAVLMLRHGLRFLTACQRRYGSVFTLHVAGFGHMVYLSDPAAIKTVFAGNPSVFHAGEANSMLAGLLGDSSLLLIDDDVHRDRRRLMSPPFHRDAVAGQSVEARIDLQQMPADDGAGERDSEHRLDARGGSGDQ